MVIEKIVVVPSFDLFADFRDDAVQEQAVQTVPPSLPEHPLVLPSNRRVGSNLTKVAFAFGQYLSTLSKPWCHASEACRTVYHSLPGTRDIINQCGKLKGLMSADAFIYQ